MRDSSQIPSKTINDEINVDSVLDASVADGSDLMWAELDSYDRELVLV